jgi:hypothetical protein
MLTVAAYGARLCRAGDRHDAGDRLDVLVPARYTRVRRACDRCGRS